MGIRIVLDWVIGWLLSDERLSGNQFIDFAEPEWPNDLIINNTLPTKTTIILVLMLSN